MEMILKWKEYSKRCMDLSGNSLQYRYQIIEALKQEFQFDSYCCSIIEPHTLCSVGTVVSSKEEQQKTIACNYIQETVVYAQLTQEQNYVVRLSDATALTIKRNRCYQELAHPLGFSDEIRAALMFEGKCYGFLTLFKNKENPIPMFQNEDVLLVKVLSPIIAEALRTYYYAVIEEKLSVAIDESGLIIFNTRLEIVSMNGQGESLFAQLQINGQVPEIVQEMWRKLSNANTVTPKHAVLAVGSDHYVILRATLVYTAMGEQQLAVFLEEASPKEMFAFLLKTTHLTSEEKAILLDIAKGFSLLEISFKLSMSVTIIKEHVQAIFEKINVENREELLQRLFVTFEFV